MSITNPYLIRTPRLSVAAKSASGTANPGKTDIATSKYAFAPRCGGNTNLRLAPHTSNNTGFAIHNVGASTSYAAEWFEVNP